MGQVRADHPLNVAGEKPVADEVVDKVAMMLEQLSSRFELVVEVAEGFSGKLQSLHEEMVSQFSEVGKQIRFLSDQIGDNRSRLMTVRSDLATEMVRLNEALGATRVQIREDIAGFADLKNAIGRVASAAVPAPAPALGDELVQRIDEAHRKLAAEMDSHAAELHREVSRRLGEFSSQGAQVAGVAGAEGLASEVRNEVKATHKALTGLAKKFERFDDKISVQVKDHDQRLRKLERQARG
jgi:seryl-tRNA synthetase